MTAVMLSIMLVLLLLGFPMMMPLIIATLAAFFLFFDMLNPTIIVQQMVSGVKPTALIAIPMFIFAADIITRGHSADRLIDLVMRFVGHIRGGLAVTVAATCTLFGAVSGSTQATVVAVGGPMRPRMLKAGYDDAFTMALTINASDIAFLIPPSIGMIVYGVLSGTSISELFIAGIGPGLLILAMFSLYAVIYARIKQIPTEPKAEWASRILAMKRAIWPAGFPLIVVGGIYGGVFSPSEAASICVLYAIILEVCIFRSVKMRELADIALSTGLVTAVVFILIGAGAGFSWALSYAEVPQTIIAGLNLAEANSTTVLITIAIAFFVGCMFVDPIVVMLILIPIFLPVIRSSGLDPVLVGIMITLQVAIGSATPPFGCDIFTAIAIFRRPYMEVIRGTPPFILMLLISSVLLVLFPQIALFLRDLSIQ
ncbi:TRAP transporter large permease [Pontibacterium granulatum]|uniref:TRAP transporter large permease n=1 Tax=Pontibacterium granulatum TaxID=2036029 RepID=UPI00249C5CDB|nr:TRAP transporter large permease [Pontibacterium granulatum]MDI3324558.1 TRAP transporter large permease [Pontibacterium granulatum]